MSVIKILFWIVLAVGAFLVVPDLATAHCKAKWNDSGLATRYTWGVGCMVEVGGK
jgi:hypothetical protein